MVGARFVTLIVIVSEASRFGAAPFSVTRTVTLTVAGPSAGVYVKAPEVALIAAPAGAPLSRLKTSGLLAGSVALAVKLSFVPSLTLLFPIEVNSGANA